MMSRRNIESMLSGLASVVLFRHAELRRSELAPHVGYALNVRRLGKHIQRDQPRQFKDSFGAQNVQISRHRGRMAGDVDNLRRCRLPKHSQQLGMTALAGWVQEDRRSLRIGPSQQAGQ